MAHEDKVFEIMQVLKVADDKTVGEIMASRGIWASGVSARNQSNRAMRQLSDLGKLERLSGFYRAVGCKSEFKEHAKLLTSCLAEILKLPVNSIIYREHSFPSGLRPDATVLLEKNNKALCFILECCRQEPASYLRSKAEQWLRWKDAKQELSKLLGCQIPHFGFVVEGKEVSWATPLREVLSCVK